MEFSFEGEIWEWQGQGAWCFISLPSDFYNEIKNMNTGQRKGFGSGRVEARIGKTVWKTSIFPDTRLKTYLLPVKKAIRQAEKLRIGTVAKVSIKLLEV